MNYSFELQMLVTREDNFPPLLAKDDDENYGVDFDENPNVDDGRNHRVECDPIFRPFVSYQSSYF
jgi:hypothetical protein